MKPPFQAGLSALTACRPPGGVGSGITDQEGHVSEVVERRTVEDRRRDLKRWRMNIEGSTASHATDEWKSRALRGIDRREARLRSFPNDMRLLNQVEAMRSPLILPVEKAAIRWQFRDSWQQGSFWTALWEAISQADEEHLEKLRRGFPDEVEAVRRWRGEPGFADTVRGLPLAFFE